MSDNLSVMSETDGKATRLSVCTPLVFTPTYETTARVNDAMAAIDDEANGVDDIAQEVKEVIPNYENGCDSADMFSTIEQQTRNTTTTTTVSFRPASMSSVDEEASDREVSEIYANAFKRHMSISPIELMNRHLILATEIYTSKSCPAKELNGNANSNDGSAPIASPFDEVSHLKNNMALIYNRMLFERRQRETYVMYNRELRKKADDCENLKENFSAQKDLLELQEKEIETMKSDINSLREKNRNLENKIGAERDHYNETIASLTKKCRQLEETNTELVQDFTSYKDQTKILQSNYQTLQAKNLELEEDLNIANIANGSTAKITKENQNLKNKLLLLGEHYQLLKNKYMDLKKNAYAYDLDLIESEARSKDLKDMRAKLDSATVHLEAFRAKCGETEALLLKKESVITELKQLIESLKLSHKTKIQAEKERINALNKVCQQYEQHILRLYAQLGLRDHENRLRESANIATNDDINERETNNSSHIANNSSSHSSANSNNVPVVENNHHLSVDNQQQRHVVHYSNGDTAHNQNMNS